MKNKNYLPWDSYFMGIALLSAKRSKDPHTRVGACIVSPEKKILSVGYNGMPIGCSDDEYPWDREGSAFNTKYLYVCHAEMNAILNYTGNAMQHAKLYVTLFPCNECSKALIQKGIEEIIYLADPYADSDAIRASKRMLSSAHVSLRQYRPLQKDVILSL